MAQGIDGFFVSRKVMIATTELKSPGVSPSNDCDLECVVVVIPALNEQRALPMVLGDIPKVGRIIVADNGSTDRTADVATRAGATVVHEPQRGYGAACLRGLAAIRESIEKGAAEPRVVVFLDADYSDHPDYLPRLVEPILNGRSDMVIGSRLLGQREKGAMPPQSVYGNKFACWLMRILFHVRYTDLGPFRAINYRKLCALEMSDTNFGWTVEMQIKAARMGIRTMEVPVPYRNRVGQSKISGTLSGTLKAGSKILFTVAKHGLKKLST